ncbi:MAG: molybdopterin-dependent oxidoreductase [Acidobacteria bacterium]|uniref:Molybdopterin-dependent oxidoreductase n=1 Tax=Candidatus Polarisedimenticola svalbardensis TaxID=2886004 RepID=A0A8J7C2U9_9BACT|nr:molybdopterin-dependent oxidoreductase [Candidatus Polarisedimenticola svalbardensis]
MSTKEIKTACNRDCPDACGMIARVEDGRVVELRGDPEHPVTRGFLCYRTNRFLKRQYHPDRLTTPLVREGDSFRKASWDEVLDRIATTMKTIRDESGPTAILHYRSGGSLGIMKHVTDTFFERFGPTAVKGGDICSGAGETAQITDFGLSDSNDLSDLLNSRTIVLWGKNPHVSNVHLLPVLKEAKENGARIVTIDPVRHKGAGLADLVLQPRTGGDLALALGVAHRLFDHDGIDPETSEYCDHFPEFERLVRSRTLPEWAAMADVPVNGLEAFAEMYAEGPAAIQIGWGMQRRRNGSTIVRAVDALATVSGNIGIPGGGASFYFQRRGAFDTSFQKGNAVAPRLIPEHSLGRSILSADPKVRMVWVTCGNPVATLPDSHATAEALRTRDLTVVVDSFLTDTARSADIVLPVTTMLEDDDLVGAYGHHWIAEVTPVVQAPGEVKTDYEIVQALAPKVGLKGEFQEPVKAWKEKMLNTDNLSALVTGAIRNPGAPQVVFADRTFPTASGKVNLLHDPDLAIPNPPPDYPLQLMALSTRKAQCAQWEGEEPEGPIVATVHPDSAPGFTGGDVAALESEMGTLGVQLKFDDRQRIGLVLVDKCGWLSSGQSANAITPAWETDAGGGAAYYETPVRIRPA